MLFFSLVQLSLLFSLSWGFQKFVATPGQTPSATNILDEFPGTSQVLCSIRCSSNPSCSSFGFFPATGKCVTSALTQEQESDLSLFDVDLTDGRTFYSRVPPLPSFPQGTPVSSTTAPTSASTPMTTTPTTTTTELSTSTTRGTTTTSEILPTTPQAPTSGILYEATNVQNDTNGYFELNFSSIPLTIQINDVFVTEWKQTGPIIIDQFKNAWELWKPGTEPGGYDQLSIFYYDIQGKMGAKKDGSGFGTGWPWNEATIFYVNVTCRPQDDILYEIFGADKVLFKNKDLNSVTCSNIVRTTFSYEGNGLVQCTKLQIVRP